MRSAPSCFVSLINWELINAGGFWPGEHCSSRALQCLHWPGHSSCWSCWAQDHCWGPGPLLGSSAEGQNFSEELVGFKVLVLLSSGNFSPEIKFHLRTTVTTSACVVYIVSFQGSLGKKPNNSPCRLVCVTSCSLCWL